MAGRFSAQGICLPSSREPAAPNPICLAPMAVAVTDAPLRRTCRILADENRAVALPAGSTTAPPCFEDATGITEWLLGTPVMGGAFLMDLAAELLREHLRETHLTVTRLDWRFVWLTPVGATLSVKAVPCSGGNTLRLQIFCHDRCILDGRAWLDPLP